MEARARQSIHPLAAIAGVAVILFCATGIAAIMGWIPKSMGRTGDISAQAGPAKPEAVAAAPRVRDPARRLAPTTLRRAAKRTTSAPAEKRVPAAVPKCAECAVVVSVRQVVHQGKGSGLGAVAGGLLGGVVGNQLGGGHGRDIMTVVGAVGGAVAGNEIEKRTKSTSSTAITLRFENGSTRVVNEPGTTAWRPGDRVRIINGRIQPDA